MRETNLASTLSLVEAALSELGHPANDSRIDERCTAASSGRCAVRRLRHAGEHQPRFKFLLARARPGLSVAFDLPTQMGYDSDHPWRGRGRQAGRRGDRLARGHAPPVRRHPARQGLDVDDDQRDGGRSCSRSTNWSPRSRACRRSQLRGTIQNDILKEYIAAARTSTRRSRRCGSSPTSSSTAPARAEVEHRSRSPATTSARPGSTRCRRSRSPSPTASPTSRPRIDAGLDVDDFAPRLSFFFNAHNNFFEEVAKFRAARRMWARSCASASAPRTREPCCCASTPRPPASRSPRSSRWSTTSCASTMQALAAVLGGTQSLHTNSTTRRSPADRARRRRIALRTQQVIAYESGVADVIDRSAAATSSRR
jgi:methylmalonyl-CoA mutase N-terminal domain/subunit